MRPTSILTVVLLLAGAVLAPATSVAAPTTSTPTVVEVEDYATMWLGSGWDYSEPSDMVLDGTPINGQVSNLRMEDGQLRWTSHDGWVSPLAMTVPGALPDSRDGVSNPIDADVHTTLTMHLWSSRNVPISVQWFRCTHDYSPCLGRTDFWVDPGWNLIEVDLPALAGTGDLGWAGDVYGLRLASGFGDTDFRLDWLRLHAGAPRVAVGGGAATWDRNTSTADNTADSPDWGPIPSGGLPVGMPPGTYHLRDGQGTLGDSVTIVGRPAPVVLDPDAAGGEDFATRVLRNPWDMTDAADVTAVANATWSFADGQLHGRNQTNDPWIRLPVGAGIDADRYHRLTVTTTYDGPFSLGFGPGGGAHGRVLFQRPETGLQQHDSRELVTFTDRPTATYDLTGPSVESGFRAWDGLVTGLRWDPNEDPGARAWRLDEIRLAADDEAYGAFDVRWSDSAHRDGTEVTIHLDRDRAGFDANPVAGGIAQHAGENVARVDLRDVAPGTWWVWVEATRGGVTGRAYATGPLVVTGRIAGSDRVGTALELSRGAFAGGSSTALVAAAGDFPDALAAAQLAAAADAPLLLNGRDALDPRVADELVRLDVDEVVVIGGTAAQSRAVIDGIRAARPAANVQRIAGANRYLTAVAVAEEAMARWDAAGVDRGEDVLLASGASFPDALAAGQLVAAARLPLLLSPPTRLLDEVADAVADIGPVEVIGVGGPAALSDDVLRATRAPWSRLAGPNRYETAGLVAEAAVAAGAPGLDVLVALGTNFPDALGAGAYVAHLGGVLLLTEAATLPSATRARLAALSPPRVHVVGGRAAIADTVVSDVRQAG